MHPPSQARYPNVPTLPENLHSYSVYLSSMNAKQVHDRQIAHMLIAMVMGGQYSASATASWVLLRLASQPDFMEDLFPEQIRTMKDPNARVHPPLHSLLGYTTRKSATRIIDRNEKNKSRVPFLCAREVQLAGIRCRDHYCSHQACP